MPLMRLSRRLARAQSITRADLFDAPAEQVIAQWQVIVCALSLLAVYIDPTHPIHYGTPMMVVLIAYSLLAVALMTVPVWKVPGRAVGYLVHIGDMTFLATLFFMSNGRANPFFAFFSFLVLLVASLRWNWLQVLGTAAVLVVVIWVTGDPRAAVPSPLDGYNFNSVIMRGIYLTLAALMIAYFSALRERAWRSWQSSPTGRVPIHRRRMFREWPTCLSIVPMHSKCRACSCSGRVGGAVRPCRRLAVRRLHPDARDGRSLRQICSIGSLRQLGVLDQRRRVDVRRHA